MKKILVTLLLFLFVLLTPVAVYSKGEQMSDVIVKQGNDSLLVSSSLIGGFSKDFDDAIKNGFEKEITFHIEIFRRWPLWPDEFIFVKRIMKTIKYDEMKKVYYASSYDGLYLEERHFDDYELMKAWVSKIGDIKIAPLSLFSHNATYFVRIKAESKFKKLPPLLENLLFFVKTTDFETPSKKSAYFSLKENNKR